MLDRFRKPIMLFGDFIAINLSIILAFGLKHDWQCSPECISLCLYFMIWANVIRLIIFWAFGLYEWSFRYASISEVIRVIRAVTAGTLSLIAIAYFTERLSMGRSILLIDYLICLCLIGSSRFLPRILIKLKQIHSTSHNKDLKTVLIVGAGAAGEMTAREIIHAKNRIYQPIGFVDDNPIKMSARIHGVRVLGRTDDIKDIVRSNNVEEIIIAIPSASGKTIRRILSKCENAESKIKILPGIHKILSGDISIKQIRDVKPEDLLGRETVEINIKDVKSLIRDKTVLVTGSAGTIGSELCRQIVTHSPKKLVMYDINENDIYFLQMELKDKYPYLAIETIIGDIKDIGLLKSTFSRHRPHIVFHSAAHKHVPLMEDNPGAAIINNVIGTRNLIYAAEHYKADTFIMISTDKAVNPTSVMGASKRIAEMIIQAKAKTAKTKFMAVRFGNVIGSSGSVVPIFKKQIENGGPLTVTHPEVKRYFMTVSEAIQLVMQASAIGKGGEIFILDMGEQINILDLAKSLIALSGLTPGEDVEIKFTGLRPGEKMSEETLLDIEHDKATKHDKIYITQPNDFNNKQLHKDIKELERFAKIMATEKIMAKLKELVPGYCHNGHKGKR